MSHETINFIRWREDKAPQGLVLRKTMDIHWSSQLHEDEEWSMVPVEGSLSRDDIEAAIAALVETGKTEVADRLILELERVEYGLLHT